MGLLRHIFKWIRLPKTKRLIIKNVDKYNYQEFVAEKLGEIGVIVHDTAIDSDSDTNLREYTFTVEIPPSVTEDKIISLIEYDVSIKSIL